LLRSTVVAVLPDEIARSIADLLDKPVAPSEALFVGVKIDAAHRLLYSAVPNMNCPLLQQCAAGKMVRLRIIGQQY